jgi:hypothetical protein
MSMEEHPVDRRWSMRQRDWAVVFWIAFLSAAAGFFVLFGLIDPLDIVGAWAEEFNIGVRFTYGLAFAFLYLLCLLAASLTMFMIRTGPSRGHAKGEGRRPIPEVHDPSESNPDLDGEDWK